MTISLLAAVALLSLVAGFATFVQVLYLESLRLRSREPAALEFFRAHIEERIGLKTEQGALTFSLIKHTAVILLALAFVVLMLGRASTWRAAGEAALLAWADMLLVTYVLPHIVYRRSSGRWLAPLAPAVRGLALTALPLASVLGFLHSVAELSERGPAEPGEATPAENIEALISAGAEEGLIEEDDRKLIHSVVAFGDKRVREVMTPRPNIVAIDADRPLEDLRQLVINEQYSRVPVFEGSIDNVLGFVHVRDMFELEEDERASRSVREMARTIRPVPETKLVSDLLREMQENGQHMVIVVDEYGATAGLATMEDLVEEIVGEIRDEHEPASDFIAEPDGSFVVAGSLDIDRLAELVGFRPAEETESTTIGGLVTEWLGRVPAAGQVVERKGVRIEVLAANELRVEQVRVARAETEARSDA